MSGWSNTDFSSTNDIFVRLVPGYSADGNLFLSSGNMPAQEKMISGSVPEQGLRA